MKFFNTSLVSAAILSAGFCVSAWAQTAAPSAPAAPATDAIATKKMDPKDMSEAEVRKIDKDAKKITLKHGPIKNLEMPGMTMVFQVRDAALLDKLALLVPGDKIMFSAEQQQGAYVVTGAEKMTTK